MVEENIKPQMDLKYSLKNLESMKENIQKKLKKIKKDYFHKNLKIKIIEMQEENLLNIENVQTIFELLPDLKSVEIQLKLNNYQFKEIKCKTRKQQKQLEQGILVKKELQKSRNLQFTLTFYFKNQQQLCFIFNDVAPVDYKFWLNLMTQLDPEDKYQKYLRCNHPNYVNIFDFTSGSERDEADQILIDMLFSKKDIQYKIQTKNLYMFKESNFDFVLSRPSAQTAIDVICLKNSLIDYSHVNNKNKKQDQMSLNLNLKLFENPQNSFKLLKSCFENNVFANNLQSMRIQLKNGVEQIQNILKQTTVLRELLIFFDFTDESMPSTVLNILKQFIISNQELKLLYIEFWYEKDFTILNYDIDSFFNIAVKQLQYLEFCQNFKQNNCLYEEFVKSEKIVDCILNINRFRLPLNYLDIEKKDDFIKLEFFSHFQEHSYNLDLLNSFAHKIFSNFNFQIICEIDDDNKSQMENLLRNFSGKITRIFANIVIDNQMNFSCFLDKIITLLKIFKQIKNHCQHMQIFSGQFVLVVNQNLEFKIHFQNEMNDAARINNLRLLLEIIEQIAPYSRGIEVIIQDRLIIGNLNLNLFYERDPNLQSFLRRIYNGIIESQTLQYFNYSQGVRVLEECSRICTKKGVFLCQKCAFPKFKNPKYEIAIFEILQQNIDFRQGIIQLINNVQNSALLPKLFRKEILWQIYENFIPLNTQQENEFYKQLKDQDKQNSNICRCYKEKTQINWSHTEDDKDLKREIILNSETESSFISDYSDDPESSLEL